MESSNRPSAMYANWVLLKVRMRAEDRPKPSNYGFGVPDHAHRFPNHHEANPINDKKTGGSQQGKYNVQAQVFLLYELARFHITPSTTPVVAMTIQIGFTDAWRGGDVESGDHEGEGARRSRVSHLPTSKIV